MLCQSLWALAAAALFSLTAAFVKLSSGQFSVMELVFYRSVFGVLFMLFFVVKNGETLRTPYIAGHLKRSILGTLSIALWFLTLGLLPLGTSVTLTYTTPLFMSANFLLLAFMRKSRAPWGLVLAIAIGFAGVVTTLKPTFGSDDLWPGLMCLGVALIDLFSYWQIKQLGDMKEPSWRIVFYFCATGVIFGFAGTMLDGGFHAIGNDFLPILGMGASATLAQLCTTRSYAYGNMLLSSCLGFSAIAFSAILGFLMFGDAITLDSALGMALIAGAGIIATINVKRSEQNGN